MAVAKQDALNIYINGHLSPSLLSSINRAESLLRSFGASQKTQAAAMQRVYAQAFGSISQYAEEAHRKMASIWEVSSGVMLGDLLARGMSGAVNLMERGVGLMQKMSSEASDAASKFELMSKGLGAILRDQGFANDLLNKLQTVAYKSPFQLMDLGGVARALAGRGMGKDQLLPATTELGDITAGLGGDTETLDRLTLAYGEAFDEKTVTKRVLNQFSKAGVPMMDAVMKSLGLDPNNEASVQQFFKMVHNKEVTFKELDKAIFDLTHNGGLFTDGMLHFALTFKGIVTTFLDMWNRFERDFGNIINDWVGMVLRWVNDSSFWGSMHEWALKLRTWSDGVRDVARALFLTLDFSKELGMLKVMGAELGDFFKKITGGFDPTTMIKRVHPLYEDYGKLEVWETTPAYDAWHKTMFSGIDGVLDKLKQTGERIDAISTRVAPLVSAFEKVVGFLTMIDDIMYGKIVPFLWDKMIVAFDAVAKIVIGIWNGALAAFDAIGKKIHEMFPWMANPLKGTEGAEGISNSLNWAKAQIDAMNNDLKYRSTHALDPYRAGHHHDEDALKSDTYGLHGSFEDSALQVEQQQKDYAVVLARQQIVTDVVNTAMKHLQEQADAASSALGKVAAIQANTVSQAQDKLNNLLNSGASDEEIKKARDDVIKAQEQHTNSTTKAVKSMDEMKAMADKVSGNDMLHLAAATDLLTDSFSALNMTMAPGGLLGDSPVPGGTFGLNSGYTGGNMGDVSGTDRVGYFGYKGDATPDSASSRGEGAAWTKGHMIPGYSAGLTEEGGRYRGIKHGEEYIDSTGHKRRWDDTAPKVMRLKSGKVRVIPDNYEDIYMPSHPADKVKADPGVSINYSPTFHIIGESDHIRRILREHSDEIAEHVRRVFDDGYARQAVV